MMVFDHYEDVPKSVQEEIIKKLKVKLNLPKLKTLPTLGRVFFVPKVSTKIAAFPIDQDFEKTLIKEVVISNLAFRWEIVAF